MNEMLQLYSEQTTNTKYKMSESTFTMGENEKVGARGHRHSPRSVHEI